jgi:uncharacterized protein YqjF (DUF2071 family)
MGEIDRLSIRARPGGLPLMHQHWGKLLFLHWPVDENYLRPLIPPALEIDKFDGSAWIAVTPYTMWGIRASFLPPIPGASAFHEMNVRTYVQLNGVPGVWFFSLDATNSLAVWAARRFYHLPYFRAEMDLRQNGKTIDYSSRRISSAPGTLSTRDSSPHKQAADSTRGDSSAAQFKATWTIGKLLGQSQSETLPFFLTERYCLYSSHGGKLYRARIFHQPWALQSATLASLESTMIESRGLPAPQGEPLLHYSEEIAVEIWPMKKEP